MVLLCTPIPTGMERGSMAFALHPPAIEGALFAKAPFWGKNPDKGLSYSYHRAPKEYIKK
jgi:hypothetical protein